MNPIKVRPGRVGRCPFCREELVDAGEELFQQCKSCRSLYHRACLRELGRCATAGCTETFDTFEPITCDLCSNPIAGLAFTCGCGYRIHEDCRPAHDEDCKHIDPHKLSAVGVVVAWACALLIYQQAGSTGDASFLYFVAAFFGLVVVSLYSYLRPHDSFTWKATVFALIVSCTVTVDYVFSSPQEKLRSAVARKWITKDDAGQATYHMRLENDAVVEVSRAAYTKYPSTSLFPIRVQRGLFGTSYVEIVDEDTEERPRRR